MQLPLFSAGISIEIKIKAKICVHVFHIKKKSHLMQMGPYIFILLLYTTPIYPFR